MFYFITQLKLETSVSAHKCLMTVSQCCFLYISFNCLLEFSCLTRWVTATFSVPKDNSLATQWFFELWEELKIRTIIGKRHSCPLVISENTLYSFCNMKSCVVVEWTVTIIFFNTSVKTKWTDGFDILDFIAMSSHVLHLSPSKMAAIMAAIVLSVEVLSPPECSSCSGQAWPWQNLWDQCENVL